MLYRTSLFLSLSLITLNGEEIESFPSFQGFKGVVNTPNSEVLQEGEFQFLYTNQVDNFSPLSSIDFRDNRKQESYFLNMGFLPNLDFSLRYSHGIDKQTNSEYLSDRIINFKYQLPFIPNDIATVAFGMQDIGGGLRHLSSKYVVASKEFNSVRTSVGYAKGTEKGSLDGGFASVEYQPLSWFQIAGEYDTKEWNGVIKSHYSTSISNRKVDVGLMAKSSLDHTNLYFGAYTNILFEDVLLPLPSKSTSKTIPSSVEELREFGFSNIITELKEDTVFFEYENTLYVYNDIDALGMVLGTLATSNQASNIVVTIKKGNINQYTVRVNAKEYKEFLKTGKYSKNLLIFSSTTLNKEGFIYHSDKFKPLLTIQPSFVLVDGSEYGNLDYTLAVQSELSMRLAKGTFISTRYNAPLSITNNFEDHGIFDYRNRNKTTSSFDQVLFSQFFQIDLPYRWMNLIQFGKFDHKLVGTSVESSINDLSGKHSLLLKLSFLEDELSNQMDLYLDKNRNEQLLSYRYYFDRFNSNIKITAGEFLYGDKGINIGFKHYFSDVSLAFNLAKTTHKFKGDHNVAKLTLSIPFGSQKRFKSKYIDIKGDFFTYNRRKTIVKNHQLSISQPHHLKEVTNNYTLEKYYLNNDKFHPTYIKKNYNRLRNIFLNN